MNVSGNTLMPRAGAPVSNNYFRLINRAPGTSAANGVTYRQRFVGKPYVAAPLSKPKPAMANNGFTTVTHKKRGRRSTRRAASRRANRRAASRRANRR